MIETLVMALIAAIIYSGSMYLKKHTGGDAEPFDLIKFAATLVVGVVVGLVSGYSGIVPTESGVAEQMGAYAGITAVAQAWLLMIYRALKGQ